MYCVYYQAHIKRDGCGFLVSLLRSFEHLAFDRTIDKQTSLFEFFVPEDQEKHFLELAVFLQQQGIILTLEKMENRLKDPQEIV